MPRSCRSIDAFGVHGERSVTGCSVLPVRPAAPRRVPARHSARSCRPVSPACIALLALALCSCHSAPTRRFGWVGAHASNGTSARIVPHLQQLACSGASYPAEALLSVWADSSKDTASWSLATDPAASDYVDPLHEIPSSRAESDSSVIWEHCDGPPREIPALVRALFLPSFDYLVRRSAGSADSVFEIEGIHELPADSASSLRERLLAARLRVLGSYPRVVFLAQPTDDQHRILQAASIDSAARLLPGREERIQDVIDSLFTDDSPRILWDEQHMPYTTAFLGGCRLLIHPYTTTRADGHVVCEHEQIWVATGVLPKASGCPATDATHGHSRTMSVPQRSATR